MKYDNYLLEMPFEDVKVSKDKLDNFMLGRFEGVEKAVNPGWVGARVVGAAERATLLAIRRRETDACAACGRERDRITKSRYRHHRRTFCLLSLA